jgi:hypothetical protein
MQNNMLQEGQEILEGRFKIMKKLGCGAFGEIFKGKPRFAPNTHPRLFLVRETPFSQEDRGGRALFPFNNLALTPLGSREEEDWRVLRGQDCKSPNAMLSAKPAQS